ncbi:L,D-transpeptidase [Myxococcota bacterium]|nr:L,D-transpeptidase [Myxococcota bacterium]
MMKFTHLFVFSSLLLALACSKEKTIIVIEEDPDASEDSTDGGAAQGVVNTPGVNGEGQPVPSVLGPLQKPKPSCRASIAEWPGPDPALPEVLSILPEGTRSLRVLTRARVYMKPDATSELTGVVKQYTRLAPTRYAPAGGGCKKYWLNLGKHRFICGENLEPDKRETLLRDQPILAPGAIVPNKYGRIRRTGASYYANSSDLEAGKAAGTFNAGDMIQLMEFKNLKGKPYWVTGKKFLVWDEEILGYHVPEYHGIDLRKLNINLPAAIVRAKSINLVPTGDPGGSELAGVKPLGHYSIRALYDRKRLDKALFYRLKEGWIPARRVLSAWPAKKVPPGLAPCEKWIEINVSMQTLVAYEGEEPVYMAPFSSGLKKYPTRYGIFRVWAKKAISDMTSGMGATEKYSVDDVPWAMFFFLGQALHGAYWHTDFGNRRSHGCVNLTPIDAKWIYEWMEPAVPPGWLEVYVNEDSPVPGTTVVVRHKYDHEVQFLRYARKLAPPEEVKRLDDLKKKDLAAQTRRMYESKGGDDDGSE